MKYLNVFTFLCATSTASNRRKSLETTQCNRSYQKKYVEVRADTFVKTDIKIKHNRPDLIVIDKRKKEILIVEVGITSGDNLQQVETEKLRKYDLVGNELSQIYGFKLL
ncbi:hypothetical protein NGRA_0956 [Nosema granulosis]|uniref:Uncharacterized protein n=1 Tax=Nosema granulosis TaxID=83296 RepID=A0A9P6GZC1_9MICR|nr:hypothetical protein NGRA_0956 [Nosema granulosis]